MLAVQDLMWLFPHQTTAADFARPTMALFDLFQALTAEEQLLVAPSAEVLLRSWPPRTRYTTSRVARSCWQRG